MGSCCHPELLVQPLTLSPLIKCRQGRKGKVDFPRRCSVQLPTRSRTSEEDTKQPDDDELYDSDVEDFRKRGKGPPQNAPLSQSFRSIESKLDHHKYEHHIGPPSSVRLSVIERMENGSLLSDEIFINVAQNGPKLHEDFGKAATAFMTDEENSKSKRSQLKCPQLI